MGRIIRGCYNLVKFSYFVELINDRLGMKDPGCWLYLRIFILLISMKEDSGFLAKCA